MWYMDMDKFWHGTLKRPYRLYARDHGGTGPVIILLHGIAASSDKWNELVPLLQPRFHCITIDLIGFGKSPKPQWYGYTMEDHLRSVHDAIRRLHIEQPFTLVGHSLGSLLATRYARTHPKSITHLVLLSPPVYAPLDTITNKLAKQRTALYFHLYKFFRVHPRITPENFERLKHILPLPRSVITNTATWVPFERTLEQCIENQTIQQDIVDITAPIDIFYGTLDNVIVPYNIRQLSKLKDVTIHKLAVDHEIGKRYAAAVAKLLHSCQ